MRTPILFYLFTIIFFGCESSEKKPQDFIFNSKFSKTPFTSPIADKKNEDFSFAIIADLTGGEREGVFEKAVGHLNNLDPLFTLSVGDLIEGGTRDTKVLDKEWGFFNSRLKKLNSPFFYVGGNHDLSSNKMREYWEEKIGPTYYHFVYKDVLFLMLNSEDYEPERMEKIFLARERSLKIESGEIEGNFEDTEYYKMPERTYGDIGEQQLEYFKKVLNENKNVRWTFLFMHKPIWKNKNNKKFDALEEELQNRNYSVFNGHEHSFSIQDINNQTYTVLSTTGGSHNSSDDSVFDQITWVSMREKPFVTHIRLDGIVKGLKSNN